MVEGSDRHRFFEAEVLRLMDRLYGTALRLTRDATDAEDLVAETVATAWAKLQDLRDPQRFEAWIIRILTNTFVSEWRRRRSRAEVEVAAEVESGDDDDGTGFSLFEKCHQPFLLWWGTPEHEFLNRVLREDLEKALDSLPEAFRIVVVLVEVQGWSYAEVADHLEVPVGTVRSRLNRGRGLLQRELWVHAQEAGLVPRGKPQTGGGEG
jgi:RNA polymerase sigma-70 factor (ECF subfamily)